MQKKYSTKDIALLPLKVAPLWGNGNSSSSKKVNIKKGIQHKLSGMY